MEIRHGKIIAIGTSADSITFTSNSVSPTQGIWSNVYLNSSTVSKFNYCNFRYANYGIYNDQTGSTNDSLIVKNSNFKRIYSNMADAKVDNYEYDFIIDNSGTLEDLGRTAKGFIKDICGGIYG